MPLLRLTQSDVSVSFSILGLAFGYFLAQTAVTDFRSFVTPSPDRNWWWYYHMDRMVGGYLAAVTAFMVQNVGPLLPESLEWTVWVAPRSYRRAAARPVDSALQAPVRGAVLFSRSARGFFLII